MYQDLNEELELLQTLINRAYKQEKYLERLSLVLSCESADIHPELMEIVKLLPPGRYARPRLIDELNSCLAARALSQRFGLLD